MKNSTGSGYSRLAGEESFLEAMKRCHLKNFVIANACSLVLFPLMGLILLLLPGSRHISLPLLAAVLLPVLLCIFLATGIQTWSHIRKLGSPAVDCLVLENKKFREYTAKERRRTRYRIVVEGENGKKWKLKDHKALAYHCLLEAGDRLRYHPGFAFPLEIYDKSRHGVLVCVFCGHGNSILDRSCARCHHPLLHSEN